MLGVVRTAEIRNDYEKVANGLEIVKRENTTHPMNHGRG